MHKFNRMIHGITYADGKMIRSAELCIRSMQKNGFDKTHWAERFDIDETFLKFNFHTLSAQRGAGYWLWKPYFIYTSLLNCVDGDILVYSDAGIEWLQPVHEIINRMDQDIFFFTNGFPHVEWCKGDVTKAINPSYYKTLIEPQLDAARDIKQVQASVIFFRVNQYSRNFVKEWLLWCQMPGFIDDSPSKAANFKTFAEHRHDQSILTELRIKHEYKVHFWPTAYSEHIRHTALPEDNYPTMFNHHRKRDPGKGGGEPEW